MWNGRIDRHPALIARCADAGDVARAVHFAREHDLAIAVRGGGHSVAGYGVCDGGLVIDLAPMKGVDVDPVTRTARVEPGLTSGEVLRAAQAYGLALPIGADTRTGIAGLALGGGFGWLGGVHGLTCDNLLSAELVTADGNMLTASAEEHPDLFWALRGGGGNFGIVTSLHFRLHPLRQVLAGLVLHPQERARDVLRFYREYASGCPDELTVEAGLMTASDGLPIVGLLACYAGPMAEGERLLAPLHAFGPPLADLIRPMALLEAHAPVDAASPAGLHYCFRGLVLPHLDDAAVEAIAHHAAARPSPRAHLVLRHMHGAAARVDPAATAHALRGDYYLLEVVATWEGGNAEPHIAWAERCWAAVQPFAREGVPVNFLGAEGPAAVRASYGPNYERLAGVKGRYDPANVFHLNQNIVPTVPR